MKPAAIKHTFYSEEEMQAFAGMLAKDCQSRCAVGLVIHLHGPLGAGKTTFTRGFLKGLGYTGHVKSPTYTLVESYAVAGIKIFHFDFYRITDVLELEYLGIEEYFNSNTICLIEWPDIGNAILPLPDLECYLAGEGESRVLSIAAPTENGKKVLALITHGQ